jgi:transposase
MPTWPMRQHRRHYGRSILNPYQAYILERWNAGCHTAIQLFHELQARGYAGSYRRVTAYVSRIRQAQGIPPRRQGRRQPLPVVAEPVAQPLTPRRATWLVLRREEKRTEAEAQQLAQLHAQSAAVAEAIDLAQDFALLVRQRQPTQLDPWLQRATTSTLEALQRFAQGLRDDYEAVKAGVTLPWSTSPVEGHINRLKMVKRQMFGRARLDLLRRRFVFAPRERLAQAPDQCEPAQADAAAEAA